MIRQLFSARRLNESCPEPSESWPKRRIECRSCAVMNQCQQTPPGWFGPPSSPRSRGWWRWVPQLRQMPSPPIRMTPPVRRSPGRSHARVAYTTLRRQCPRPRRRCPRQWAVVYREARCQTAHPMKVDRPPAACQECPAECPACLDRFDARATPLSATGGAPARPSLSLPRQLQRCIDACSQGAQCGDDGDQRGPPRALTCQGCASRESKEHCRDQPADHPRRTRHPCRPPWSSVAWCLSETRSPTAPVRRGVARGGGGS